MDLSHAVPDNNSLNNFIIINFIIAFSEEFYLYYLCLIQGNAVNINVTNILSTITLGIIITLKPYYYIVINIVNKKKCI
jgi:hypothetical protein